MNRKSLSALSLVIALTGAALSVSTQVASASAPSPKAPKAPMAKPASAAQTRAALRSGKLPGARPMPAPVNGYVQVNSTVLNDPANSQVAGSVSCPRGTKVVGGGAVITSNSLNQNINGSLPVSTTTWQAYVNNADSVDGTFVVYATCVKKISKYKIVTGTPVSNPSGAQTRATAACARGSVALGGGGLGSSTAVSVNLNSSFPFGGASTSASGWAVDVNNNSAGANNATAYVVCGAKPLNYAQQSGPAVSNPNGAQTFASVACSTGSPLGGGALSGSSSVLVNMNTTYPNGTSWIDFENNASATTASLTPYAVCAS